MPPDAINAGAEFKPIFGTASLPYLDPLIQMVTFKYRLKINAVFFNFSVQSRLV